MNLARDIGNVKFCAQVTLHDLALRDQADKTSTAFKAFRELGLGRHFRQNNEPPRAWNCNFSLVRRAGHESDRQ